MTEERDSSEPTEEARDSAPTATDDAATDESAPEESSSDEHDPEASDDSEPDELDADGRLRPAFILDFPQDPELDKLVAAFEAGDFATVRRDAETVARNTDDEEVREAALELRRRIDPDPLVKRLLLVSVLLLVALVVWSYFK